MDDLALQIGFVDGVEVDDAERPYASRGEIEQRRAAQTPAPITSTRAFFSRFWPSIPTSGMIK